MEAERSLYATDINDIDGDLCKKIVELAKENADLKAIISRLKKTEIPSHGNRSELCHQPDFGAPGLSRESRSCLHFQESPIRDG